MSIQFILYYFQTFFLEKPYFIALRSMATQLTRLDWKSQSFACLYFSIAGTNLMSHNAWLYTYNYTWIWENEMVENKDTDEGKLLYCHLVFHSPETFILSHAKLTYFIMPSWSTSFPYSSGTFCFIRMSVSYVMCVLLSSKKPYCLRIR